MDSSFLYGDIGRLTRGRDRKYFDEAVSIRFVLDASPYGLGGVAYIDRVPIAFFWSDLTEHDEHNTTVAIRSFSNIWVYIEGAIKLRSDNMSASTLAAQLKCTGHSNLIARRWLGARFVEHLPGIINTVADALSRLSDRTRVHCA